MGVALSRRGAARAARTSGPASRVAGRRGAGSGGPVSCSPVPRPSPVVETASRLRALREETAWAMLRGELGHVVAAILRARFLDADETSVPAALLVERVADDLDDLRAAGFDLPRTAQQYCDQWRTAGLLERRAGVAGQDETYELSSEAVAALRVIADLEAPPRTATESRLTTVMDQLARLAQETEPDPEARVAALVRERDRLDARIAEVRDGGGPAADPRVAVERVRDVLALADQLPADFARVRRELERLNGRFRRDVLAGDGTRGEVLDALFRGVDVLAEEEAGRSFRAFYALLVDLERHDAFSHDIEAVLSRDFAHRLEPEEREFLSQLVGRLIERGGQVHDVYVTLARSLRGFVQHRDYVTEREVGGLIVEAQRRLGEAARTTPLHRSTGVTLTLGSAQVGSVGQWVLHEPRHERPAALEDAPVEAVDLDTVRALVRESEIDLRELDRDIEATLDATGGVASLGDVLTRHPASQGLGSVLGLVHLAARGLDDGRAVDVAGETEVVPWSSGADGRPRTARVPRMLFVAPGASAGATGGPGPGASAAEPADATPSDPSPARTRHGAGVRKEPA